MRVAGRTSRGASAIMSSPSLIAVQAGRRKGGMNGRRTEAEEGNGRPAELSVSLISHFALHCSTLRVSLNPQPDAHNTSRPPSFLPTDNRTDSTLPALGLVWSVGLLEHLSGHRDIEDLTQLSCYAVVTKSIVVRAGQPAVHTMTPRKLVSSMKAPRRRFFPPRIASSS